MRSCARSAPADKTHGRQSANTLAKDFKNIVQETQIFFEKDQQQKIQNVKARLLVETKKELPKKNGDEKRNRQA